MKVSTSVIKALAIGDMVDWITKFKSTKDFNGYDDEAKEKYFEYIKKIQEKILKEL